MKKWYSDYLNKDYEFDRVRWVSIFSLLIVITGCFGFLYEFIFYYFNGGMTKFYWRGGNFLPWINIYATGSIMIYILTYKFRKSPLRVFLLSFFSTGILEYVSGYFMYILRDGRRCWDYNNEILNFGNINGFVCLRSVLFFAISGLFLIYVVIPFCFYLASRVSRRKLFVISVLLCSIVLADEFYNLLISRIFHLPRAYDVYKSIGFNYVKFR